MFFTGLSSWKIEFNLSTISHGVETKMNLTKSKTFALNQLPYNGTCSVSPENGYALSTYFDILCQYWADKDGEVVNYEYFGN